MITENFIIFNFRVIHIHTLFFLFHLRTPFCYSSAPTIPPTYFTDLPKSSQLILNLWFLIFQLDIVCTSIMKQAALQRLSFMHLKITIDITIGSMIMYNTMHDFQFPGEPTNINQPIMFQSIIYAYEESIMSPIYYSLKTILLQKTTQRVAFSSLQQDASIYFPMS